MEQERLAIAWAGIESVNLRIDVAVGDENIEPGVVVHVEKSRAPTNVRIAGRADTRGPTHVVESLRPHIAIERVGLLLKMRDEKAETAAVVEVAPIDAHVTEFRAFPAEGHTGEHSHVSERAVVIVVVEIV